MGLGAVSHQEMLAWSQLSGIKVSPSEVEAFKAIDSKFRSYNYQKTHPDRPLGSLGSQLQAIKDDHDKQEEQKARARERLKLQGANTGKDHDLQQRRN